MDLNAVRMFIDVVQAGSFSAAAQRSHVPLPTLSRRIRELEQQIKVQLFERSTRGARLTDAGTRLYEHAVRGMELLADGERAVKSDQAQLNGHLRLSIPPSFEPWWELLRTFQSRYPNIKVSVYTTERKVDFIQDGIDVALRVGSVVDESLIGRHIVSYRHIVVAAPEFITRFGEPKTPDDLQKFPSAAWSPSIGARCVWQLGGQPYEIQPHLTGNDYFQIRDAVLSGEVLTELPPFLAAPFFAKQRLVKLLPQHLLPEQKVHLLYHPHRHLSTIVRTYLDYCKATAQGYLST